MLPHFRNFRFPFYPIREQIVSEEVIRKQRRRNADSKVGGGEGSERREIDTV